MKTIAAEKLVNEWGVEVYPIALVKLLLNRRKILSFFNRASSADFEIRGTKYKIDHEECEVCKSKKDQGILCRQHTSIQRILTAESVLYDTDTGVYLYKNEIYKMVGDKLVIIYCPHPKLINGPITDSRVRRVNPITIEDETLKALPEYKNIQKFSSLALLEENIKCWFNDEFSIITLPEDRECSNWCLTANN